MKYKDLRDFLEQLERQGELKRISQEIDPYLEMTEVCDRTLRAGGPALLFERPKGHDVPVLGNLFGTPRRVALGMGEDSVEALREVGKLLAFLKEPDPPKGLKEAWQTLPVFKKVLDMAPKTVRSAPCQDVVWEGADVDLARLPIQTCWPGDAAPLITWGLVVTKGPTKSRQNMGIYRQQVIGPNRVIMRWLSHRGGALDFRDWQQAHPGEPFPVAVALGADPATILGAVTPVPDTLSEHAFAGLLRGGRTELVKCLGNDLLVPASAEYVLEGHIQPGDLAAEGPYGDHTGYYNEVDDFPVFTIERITHRRDPIYHSTYTGRPPDEPAILGVALNEVFVPTRSSFFPAASFMAHGSSSGGRKGDDEDRRGYFPAEGDLSPVELEGHRTVKGHSGDFFHHFADPETQGFETFGAAVLCRHLRNAAKGAVGEIPQGNCGTSRMTGRVQFCNSLLRS